MLADEGEPTYYNKFKQGEDGKVVEITASEQEATGGSTIHDLNPQIYIRTKTPSANILELLQTLNLSDFFEVDDGETGFEFSYSKCNINPSDFEQLQLNDPEQRKFLEQLDGFTRAEDA